MKTVLQTLKKQPVIAGGLGMANGYLCIAVVGPDNPPARKTIPVYEMRLDNKLYELLKSHRETWDC